MKKLIALAVVALLASASFGLNADGSGLVAGWDFEDGAFGGVSADISGEGTASDAYMLGATVVTDATRGLVLNTNATGYAIAPEKAEMDITDYATLAFWAKMGPTPNGWWSMTIGKGGQGSPRIFIDDNPYPADTYVFGYSDLLDADGNPYNVAPGCWGSPFHSADGSRDAWHQIVATFVPAVNGDGVAVKQFQIYIDGVICGAADSQTIADALVTTDADFVLGGGNGAWDGMLDDVAFYRGYLVDGSQVAAAYRGEISNFDFDVMVPEPATMALLGLGALALIRKK